MRRVSAAVVAAAVSVSAVVALGAPGFGASDWVATGPDCALFAAGDLDGDGFGDVVTINGGRDLCVAYSVNGWKAAGWEALAHGVDASASGVAVGAFGAKGRIGVAVVLSDKVVVYARRSVGGGGRLGREGGSAAGGGCDGRGGGARGQERGAGDQGRARVGAGAGQV
ncbi:MAG: hypothetical protein K2Q09_08515 [Phycisphaerales bacterium]|nr:hypothetical protein [Phycisphaerales bacterium]